MLMYPLDARERYRAIFPIIKELNEIHHAGNVAANISDAQVILERGGLRFIDIDKESNLDLSEPKRLLYISNENISGKLSEIPNFQLTQEANTWATGFLLLRYLANDQSDLTIPTECIEADGNINEEKFFVWRENVIQELYKKIPDDFDDKENLKILLDSMLRDDPDMRATSDQAAQAFLDLRKESLTKDFTALKKMSDEVLQISLPPEYQTRLKSWQELDQKTIEQAAYYNEKFYARNYGVLEKIVADGKNDKDVSDDSKEKLTKIQEKLAKIKPIDYRTGVELKNGELLQVSVELYRLNISPNMSTDAKEVLVKLIEEKLLINKEVKLNKTELTRVGSSKEPYRIELSGQEYAIELPHSLILLPKTETDKYKILVMGDMLGEGSFGKVKDIDWEIEYDSSKKEVVSIAPNNKVNKSQIIDDDKNPRSSIEEEGEILNLVRSTEKEPQIVIQLSSKSGEKIYTIMPKITGDNLDELKVSTLTVDERLQHIKSLIQDLNHIHEKDIVHSDVRESNIKQNADKKLEFIDFGLAYKVEKSTGAALGTPPYFAPEIFKDVIVEDSKKLDVWTTGLVALRHLVGKQGEFIRTDFPGGLHSIPTKREEYINEWMLQLKKLPLEKNQKDCLTDVLQNMLEEDPKKRITSQQAVEMLKGLDKAPDKNFRQTQPQSFSGELPSKGTVARLKEFYEKQAKENFANSSKPEPPKSSKKMDPR